MHSIKFFKEQMNAVLVSPVLVLLTLLCSCKKWITVETPATQIDVSKVFTNDASATAAVVGIYSQLGSTEMGIANSGITMVGGLLADELQNYSPQSDHDEFFNNNATPSNNTIRLLWTEAYQNIFAANLVVEQLDRSQHVSGNIKSQLKGECIFIRAFLHFYLLQLYGPIPYLRSTDYQVNNSAPRMDITQVYKEIIADLGDSELLLSDSYPTGERVRPNKAAVQALLSRVHLYTREWSATENYATQLINNNNYSLEDPAVAFLKNSPEAIWQLMPVLPVRNTNEGYYFALEGSPLYAALRPAMLNRFDSNDLRKIHWIKQSVNDVDTFYYPYKYKINSATELSEYYTVFRLAEQFLIRAEARARLGNIQGSLDDINAVRQRAQLAPVSTTDANQLLDYVFDERSRELFAEWGNRWLDLRRFQKTEEYLSPIKPGWQNTDTLLPVPQIQMQNNPAFYQNAGY